MKPFVLGATALAMWAAGVFFLRYWRQTQDAFFVWFAAGFWILAVNRTVLAWFGSDYEHVELLHLLRLAGNLVLVIAILRKNLAAARAT